MNAEETKKVAQMFAMTAAYYRTTLSDDVVKMYANDLADLDYGPVASALVAFRKNPANRFMPLPAHIREMITPTLDPIAKATEIASRIVGAITKFGWSNPSGAREYMGDIGWEIVGRNGGWEYVCENHGTRINPTTFMAQARDLAKTMVTYSPEAMSGALGLPLGREQISRVGEVASILGRTIKEIK